MKQNTLDITYSTDASDLAKGLAQGFCVHLLCTDGNGDFTYGDRTVSFHKNDVVIISRSDLLKDFHTDNDFRMECVIAPFKFLYNQLPSNHYGIGGCISLWDNPVISLDENEVSVLLDDFHKLRDRMGESDHKFFKEMIGSLALTMVYDLFDFHARREEHGKSSERKVDLVSELTKFLSSGRTKEHRDVAYYADLLNVSSKYLGNIVRRQTGRSVSYLIDQYTMPMIIEYLKDSKMTLTQIADEFNFASLSYFTRYTQKHLGMTPSEYRASLQPKKRI